MKILLNLYSNNKIGQTGVGVGWGGGGRVKIFGQFEGGEYLGGHHGCLKSRIVFLAVDGDQTVILGQ